MSEYPHAVVLDLNFAGYGIVRSLADYGVPVVGFYCDKYLPESFTRKCIRKIHFSGPGHLLDELLALPETCPEKPVLYLTSDTYVVFFLNNRRQLEEKYRIHMPDRDTTELALDKNRFADFSKKHAIRIPHTLRIGPNIKFHEIEDSIRFPAIFKPFLRRPAWIEARMPKAFFLHTIDAFKKVYAHVMTIEKDMVLQEWIPGPDENVYYCLTYYNRNSECIGAFTGYKLRQWPVGTGSTATTAPSDSEFVRRETQRIFNLMNYQGFGSVEFKKHQHDNCFYLMEPTVGRLNQQEFAATLNGVNLPLIAYNSLTEMTIPEKTGANQPVIYIDELAEFSSTLVHLLRRYLTVGQWYRSLQGNRAYRYFDPEDMTVFFMTFLKIFRKLICNS